MITKVRYCVSNVGHPRAADVVRSADCVVILTDHGSVDYTMVEDSAQLIVDTRNAIQYKGPKVFRLGDGTGGR